MTSLEESYQKKISLNTKVHFKFDFFEGSPPEEVECFTTGEVWKYMNFVSNSFETAGYDQCETPFFTKDKRDVYLQKGDEIFRIHFYIK